ncbi:MAG: DNA gyrase inhibitor YacG [Bryobacteraceae bacterium]|jgi:hypothetical protein
MSLKVACPTCKKRVELGTAYFPFCSERCQLIDLGRWADEEYCIPVVNQAPGAGEESAGAGGDAGRSGGHE